MNSLFYKLIASTSRKRVPLEGVKRAFFEAHPELASNPERYLLLLNAVRAMETEKLVQLPAKGSWEKIGNPPLPNWIQVVREDLPRERVDYASVPWVPELGFWTELKPPAIDAAVTINEFLLKRRTSLRLVPIKERSLEIFGDEKRLDAMRFGNTLFGGRLALAAIGAFQVPLPLPYRQAQAPGRPVLVVENHNSFWSFGEWNQTARQYAAVVYGSGNEFRSSGAALGQVLQEVSGVGAEYLGDLDPTGVRIPLEYNLALQNEGIPITPATQFYRWLLATGLRRNRTDGQEFLGTIANDWLGVELGEAVSAMWAAGQWIPQEALGFEALQLQPLVSAQTTILGTQAQNTLPAQGG